MMSCKVPFSIFATEQAERTLASLPRANAEETASIAQARTYYGRFNDARLARMLEVYDVRIAERMIAGVRCHVVTPSPRDTAAPGAALLCLHGGAFLWGSGSGALVEAIPIAAASGLPVVAVNYRLAPEYRFPAATEDVLAVYDAMLRDHAPAAIGVYGCSAGAVLTGQAIAALIQRGTAGPGAAAMLCGAPMEFLGDSAYASAILMPSQDPAEAEIAPFEIGKTPYFEGRETDDLNLLPGVTPDCLSAFPPCLLVTGSRDFAASSATSFHRLLRRNGVDAELLVFDGLWHAYQVDPDLPESRETYAAVGDFFSNRLAIRRSR